MKKKFIIDAATELFMNSGFGPVSMEAVAKKAQVSKATLYAYFSSKDELFKTALANYYKVKNIESPTLPTTIAKNIKDLESHLLTYIKASFSFYTNDDVVILYRLLISESKQFVSLFELFFSDPMNQMTYKLTDYLNQFALAHQLNNKNIFYLACHILDLIRGASLWVKLVNNPQKQMFLQDQQVTIINIVSSVKLLIQHHFNLN